MSTSSRLTLALCGMGLAVPIPSALADQSDPGGASYSSAPKQGAKPASSTKPGRIRHLGDRIPVRKGMKGRDVKILQDMLNRAGLSVGVDGAFGNQTLTALRTFERRAHRTVNGVLDSGDLAALKRIVASGGFPPPPPPPELPAGSKAKVAANGLAAAPADAPEAVKAIIRAGNRIASKPYHYGGGHGHWNDTGYDCSGSVSYALHFAGLLKVSRDSTGFESYGSKGYGQWVTIYANGGHAWMMVAGLRFDTSGLSSAGSRWQTATRSVSGYVIRHPNGL
ncbi:MAG: hypothetical protein QOG68_1152 [Solirubrobacteraceae bacterium]|nr:hypothetical protein [Solirubrobacteraceae bacterium]